MSVVRVKVCGITRKEDLDAAATAGADALGFVVGVASSPRNLSLTDAEKLIRQVPPFIKSVLVMVPTSLEDLVECCEALNPDAVQIHRENMQEVCDVRDKLQNMLLIGALNLVSSDAVGAAAEMAKAFDAVLLDSFVQGKHGGTGVVHDWKLSKQVKQLVHPKP